MTSLSKACFELSNTIKTFRLNRSAGNAGESASKTSSVSGTITRVIRSATSRMKGIPNNAPPDDDNGSVANADNSVVAVVSVTSGSSGKRNCDPRSTLPEIWKSESFLDALFAQFCDGDLLQLRLVHPLWKRLIDCRQGQYRNTVVVVNYRQNEAFSERLSFLASILQRGVRSLKLVAIADRHCERFCDTVLPAEVVRHVTHLSINSSNISDRGLEAMLEKFKCLESLKLAG